MVNVLSSYGSSRLERGDVLKSYTEKLREVREAHAKALDEAADRGEHPTWDALRNYKGPIFSKVKKADEEQVTSAVAKINQDNEENINKPDET